MGEGGGGGAAGAARPKALRAAVSARECALVMGGGGIVGALCEGGGGGGLGAEGGGIGGAAGGAGDDGEKRGGGGGGGGGILPDGLRKDGGGMGGFFPIRGGLGFEGTTGEELEVCGAGRIEFLKADTAGLERGEGAEKGTGGAEPGGRGGAPGGFGADDTGREGASYDESVSAPVLTPPDFRSLGIPPANRPPSCGGAAPTSLDARSLLAPTGPGEGGAPPVGRRPGTGGAPMAAGADDFFSFPTMGAERSLMWVTFLSRVPLVMSPRRAP
jgi:hypothetical protein